MNKIITIDEAYRKRMAEDAEVHKDDLVTDLINLTSIMNRYIQDADVILRMYRKCQREYEETFAERYSYYRFKGEFVCGDKEAEKQAKADAAVIQKKEEMDNLEANFDLITQFKDIIKTKGFQIKNLIDYEKFRMGD